MSEKAADNSLLLPGLKPVLETLLDEPAIVEQIFCKKDLKRPELLRVLDLASQNNIPVKFVEVGFLQNLCGGPKRAPLSHQGVAARIRSASFCSLEELLAAKAPLPLFLALDQIQDNGNMGTLARTLYALGGAGMILPAHNSALPGPAAMRASAGALRKLPVARVTNLARALDLAEENGLAIYGTACPNSSASRERYINVFNTAPELPAIIVLGNEDRGIRPAVAKRCQKFLHIPMARQFDSLNVAQTGAILVGLCVAKNFNTPIITE